MSVWKYAKKNHVAKIELCQNRTVFLSKLLSPQYSGENSFKCMYICGYSIMTKWLHMVNDVSIGLSPNVVSTYVKIKVCLMIGKFV